MTRLQLLNKFAEIVSGETGHPESAVEERSEFERDLGFDSLDRVCVIMAVECEFGIDIPDYEEEKIVTVQEALDLISRKLELKEGQQC
jgi:acyl carrier protein